MTLKTPRDDFEKKILTSYSTPFTLGKKYFLHHRNVTHSTNHIYIYIFQRKKKKKKVKKEKNRNFLI